MDPKDPGSFQPSQQRDFSILLAISGVMKTIEDTIDSIEEIKASSEEKYQVEIIQMLENLTRNTESKYKEMRSISAKICQRHVGNACNHTSNQGQGSPSTSASTASSSSLDRVIEEFKMVDRGCNLEEAAAAEEDMD